MKLHRASRRELSRMCRGILIFDGILITALFLLSRFGLGTFGLSRILLSTAGGSGLALLNFAVLCLTVQRAADMENEKARNLLFQLSYHIRLLAQAAWILVCFVFRPLHFLAGAAPILFPCGWIFSRIPSETGR